MLDPSSHPLPYFAYGSNLDPEQMQQRCPGAEAAGVARLDGWAFRIGRRGVATIVESPGTQVWGGLWKITDDHLAALDRAEGVRVGLYRREVLSMGRGDETVDAVVYIEDFDGDGEPRPGYLERIVRGAAWFELPPDYRSSLGEVGVRWAPPPTARCDPPDEEPPAERGHLDPRSWSRPMAGHHGLRPATGSLRSRSGRPACLSVMSAFAFHGESGSAG